MFTVRQPLSSHNSTARSMQFSSSSNPFFLSSTLNTLLYDKSLPKAVCGAHLTKADIRIVG